MDTLSNGESFFQSNDVRGLADFHNYHWDVRNREVTERWELTTQGIYSADTQTRTLGRRLSNHNIFWNQKIRKFFCKWTNDIHKSEGRFLKGQVTSNCFKVFNSCIVEPWIYLVHKPKKTKKRCTWTIFFQVSGHFKIIQLSYLLFSIVGRFVWYLYIQNKESFKQLQYNFLNCLKQLTLVIFYSSYKKKAKYIFDKRNYLVSFFLLSQQSYEFMLKKK